MAHRTQSGCCIDIGVHHPQIVSGNPVVMVVRVVANPYRARVPDYYPTYNRSVRACGEVLHLHL